MNALDTRHALGLLMLALAVGILSVVAFRTGRQMKRNPLQFQRQSPYRSRFIPDWLTKCDRSTVQKSGRFLAALSLFYGIFSFTLATILGTLLVFDHAGYGRAVAPIAEFLSRFEAGLS